MAYKTSRSVVDPDKREALTEEFYSEELPKHLQNLDTLGKLYGNGGHFFVGNQLTWADLLFHSIIETFVRMKADYLDNFPWLKQNRAEVENQPKIAEYLKNRPRTQW
ncbi:unnamed protein product [Adineta steineri]|uniref:glutathione transferase n=1 Tax=Adineta steineri TaxID=433720 RepID=A0A814P3Y8_9BILA|nr:unnamed protein product [Adineta steineri]CAF3577967.1 unnamed protein product [Adineta steineri]